MPIRIGSYKHPNIVKPQDNHRPSAARRGYGRAWREGDRIAFIKANPLCIRCLDRGRVEPTTDVDHIIPRSKGGLDVWENYQALCHSCHSQKTAAEDFPAWRTKAEIAATIDQADPGAPTPPPGG